MNTLVTLVGEENGNSKKKIEKQVEKKKCGCSNVPSSHSNVLWAFKWFFNRCYQMSLGCSNVPFVETFKHPHRVQMPLGGNVWMITLQFGFLSSIL